MDSPGEDNLVHRVGVVREGAGDSLLAEEQEWPAVAEPGLPEIGQKTLTAFL